MLFIESRLGDALNSVLIADKANRTAEIRKISAVLGVLINSCQTLLLVSC